MPLTVEEIYMEAMALSNDAKASLAEKLVASIGSNVDPQIERIHHDHAKGKNEKGQAHYTLCSYTPIFSYFA